MKPGNLIGLFYENIIFYNLFIQFISNLQIYNESKSLNQSL